MAVANVEEKVIEKVEEKILPKVLTGAEDEAMKAAEQEMQRTGNAALRNGEKAALNAAGHEMSDETKKLLDQAAAKTAGQVEQKQLLLQLRR